MKRDNNINLKLFVVLNKCSITVGRKSEKTIRPTGLTIPQFSVLEILYNKGDLKVGDIIEKSLSTVGNISLVIDNLCKLGYTEKKKCTLDKRITYVTLTEKGKELMDNMWTPHVEEMDNIMSVLNLEEKETLINLLKKLGKS
jgi:MarR family 2-MHQ and catechol resistance regulon transcriptional repressor